jgi:hypothetical protein
VIDYIKSMKDTTTTTTNENHPLEGYVSRCCGQAHIHGEHFHVGKREATGYCSLCEEPVEFVLAKDYDGGEDRYLDSSWEDRAEMGCW